MRKLGVGAILLAFVAGGCAHRQMMKNSSQSAAQNSAEDALADGEPSLRNSILHSIDELKTIHFPYDSASLSAGAMATLRHNAEWLKNNPHVRVQVAGHCDQRGTVEYNLALGQRRAKAVREYYLSMGVPASKIATISYGKEKPLCNEMTESCWQKNRRAETWGAFPQDISRAPKSDSR